MTSAGGPTPRPEAPAALGIGAQKEDQSGHLKKGRGNGGWPPGAAGLQQRRPARRGPTPHASVEGNRGRRGCKLRHQPSWCWLAGDLSHAQPIPRRARIAQDARRRGDAAPCGAGTLRLGGRKADQTGHLKKGRSRAAAGRQRVTFGPPPPQAPAQPPDADPPDADRCVRAVRRESNDRRRVPPFFLSPIFASR
jgi:hypothetical protein